MGLIFINLKRFYIFFIWLTGIGYAYFDHGIHYEWRVRTITFYASHQYLKVQDNEEFVKIDVPDDMRVSTYADQLLFSPRYVRMNGAIRKLGACYMYKCSVTYVYASHYSRFGYSCMY